MTAKRKSRRLELRVLGEADAQPLFDAIAASRDQLKRRLKWVSAVASVDDCRAFVFSCRAAAQRGSSVVHGIFESKTGALAGVVALQDLLKTPGIAELAAWTRADRFDRGYASEACRLAARRAFRGPVIHKLFARIDPVNRSARKVLQKLGFRYEGCLRREKRINGRWIDQECWGLLKEEWKK